MKTEKNQICKCELCGNVIEVTTAGAGTLSCCEQPMKELVANTVDAAAEKHVPVINEIEGGGCSVTVGAVEHPMTEAHYIEWVEIINEEYVNRKYLKPEDAPKADFYVNKSDKLKVRAYCNLHGLWEK